MKIRGGRIPGDLYRLAEAVALLYGQPGTEAAIEELADVAQDYRFLTKREGRVEWMTFMLRLVLTCPVLLSRPRGLEWVTDDLQVVLSQRGVNPAVDRDFWKAMAKVRELAARQRPARKEKDFFRFWMVKEIMQPVTTDPEKGLVRVRGCNKTQAVMTLAEMEERRCGRRPDLADIWRSLRRVKDYATRLLEQVERAKRVRAAVPQKER